MGKQAKLKKARREGTEVKKEPVYNMTQAQLDEYVNREVMKFKKEIARDITNSVIKTMLIQCFDVLHNVFGFSTLRLKRFRYYLDQISETISYTKKDDPKYDYITETVNTLEEQGVEVEQLLTGAITEYELRRRSDMEKDMTVVNKYPFEK